MTEPRKTRRPALRRAAFLLLLILAVLSGVALVRHPETPLPDQWNLWEPLRIADPVTPVTGFKLRRALDTDGMCRAVLADAGAAFDALPELEESAQCHIRDRLAVSGLSGTRLARVETSCETALRLALWIMHGVQPAAEQAFGTGVRQVHHFSSYNCRAIRTVSGRTGRMSTHATASAIDISGVTLEDGRRISLLGGWDDPDTGPFLRALRDSSCAWFGTTLGPDYNALHADHFHLQNRGYGTCR
ncbi:extensin family protein [Thalassococcus sp. BH17M4-6]|uniref:extensin-like domain-containing protein n=1 Tax=Thalassococcus sp. BH17M4-6 TaxID=3413148 RepID=UPI003BE5943C